MSEHVTTITVNQWRIADNAKNGTNDPVLCVNTYAYRNGTEWGKKIGETVHCNTYEYEGNIKVVYDPANKTPCGASAWMEHTDKGSIYVKWCVEDVAGLYPDLTEDQCIAVLDAAKRWHDAENGINWTVLSTIATEMYGDPMELYVDKEPLEDICG